MKRTVVVLVAVFLALGVSDAWAQDFQVVVNASSTLSEISKSDLSKIFRKRVDKLPSGEEALPVDQKKDSPVCEAFSRAVYGRSAGQMVSFWQQQIFAGKDVPPVRHDSDEAVIEFVRSNPGAIGYVSSGSIAAGVKVVRVVG